MGELKDYLYDWSDPKISDWKKVLRIVFRHDFDDINPRGFSVNEVCSRLLAKHQKELSPDELEFIRRFVK